MSKEEHIAHWCDIIMAVFSAESNLPELDKWNERLEMAKTASQEERDRICDAYVRAIAEEILSKGWTFDEG